MPVTLRFQSTGAVPGDGSPIVMRGPSLTIGRGQENDIVLPDPDRLISKSHCAIEDQNGNVVVIDFSTNGTFLNYGKVPLGRVPTPLNDGDVLTLGGYELVVAITSGRADPMHHLAPPVDDGPVSHGRADAAPDLMDLLDDHSSKRVDFLDDLMGAAPPRGPSTVVREDPIDELDLPHLRDAEDPILGHLPEPLDDMDGASARYHSPSLNDGFSTSARKANVIPDDWDEDFLAPTPKARGGGGGGGIGEGNPDDPFGLAPAPPPPAPRPAPPPPDPMDDLLAPTPSVAPPPPHAPLPTASVVPRPPRPKTAAEAAADAASPFNAPVPPGRLTSVVPPPPVSVPPPPAVSAAPPPPVSVAPAPPAPVPPPAAAPVAAPARPAGHASGQGDALRAFLEGAGAEDLVIPDQEIAATMARMGLVMRILIEGLREILMTRAEIKGEFRMERTQISAGGNNPLKFALSPEHAVEMIVRPKAKGYMDAPTAVREALKDIKAHEVAMVTGMEAAIKDVLKRLDPAILGERVSGGGIGGFLGGKKARLWEEFERLYGTISNEAENDFHEFFAKAFARAYQDQLERLK
ncbi:MAG: type VI secretion system-associated FHA domain protein TagH [Paracoccaceae bacterium]|nr:MAG: type VI secretion system-associated FHA domain protein TagH [Paracoccaceae bacterium]